MRTAFAWAAAVATLGAGRVLACPLCSTGTGDVVRAGIADDFGAKLLATAAPFPVLAAIVALLHWGWPGRRSRR